MVIRDLLSKSVGKDYAKNIVAVTDPAKGTMRQICNAEGYFTLPVPDGVGGRFSVLSPVGLFSAAMCGIDIDALLQGARRHRQAPAPTRTSSRTPPRCSPPSSSNSARPRASATT